VSPRRALLAATLLLPALGCGDGSSSSSPPPVAGAIPVRGTEHLFWNQAGEVSSYRFRAYVDGVAALLDAATCDAAQAGPQGSPCVSPLPPLTKGVHRITLTASWGLTGPESARSEPVTVQMLASTASGVSSQPEASYVRVGSSGTEASSRAVLPSEAGAPTGPRTIGDTLATGDGLTFDARVVARGLDAPTQIALAPDGRLLVAERTGRVLIVPAAGSAPADATVAAGEGPADATVALDARAMLDPPPASPPGLALHPDFPRNHLVYLAYVALDRRDEPRLQLVRLREAGGTLGEPALLFDEALAAVPSEGPRLAFGPDRLLYVALAQAVEFQPEASAGPSGGTFLRLRDDGRAADGSAVFSHGVEQPVAFAWHPDTGALWAVLTDADGRTTLRAIGPGRGFGASDTPSPSSHLDAGSAFAPGGLLFRQEGPAGAQRSTAWVALPDNESLWRVTPGDATQTEVLLPHALGRIGAIVQGENGVVFVATRNRDGWGDVAAEDDLIVRLTPRTR
jgi:glucose/arabinose dehydrogenase